MMSKLYIARYGSKFLVDEDNDSGYIERRGDLIVSYVLTTLVDSTKIKEHYDAEGTIRYIEYMIYLKG